ncbi:N-terminal C2 in EEIG1 and EHBP1 proteins-domain-containing protein [Mycena belliarum]|uniref:N-terminal C2 in EEIG1 and EHBP1 proteins-domain-containing protein n=1 Tax=Mycena belliarum TaxID=1033014 RepID=A0AAD6UKQ9_9AGAR|nr:N-terminal C2 in EEIG1 and EHBP1 proteins-domain-containing protein [Mycena belliae]
MTHNTDDADPAPHPTGLRAQLHHLLPRHALFHVRITVHQLASVPLVTGEFGVRWQFKNTHKVKGKGKAKQPDPERDGDGDSFGSADTSTEEPQTQTQSQSTQSHSSHHHSASTGRLAPDDQDQAITSARGQTPWLPLRDHAVSWEQPLSAVVQMSIDRDTHRLLPHPFKLTVLQRVIAHDPDAPQKPRFGAVEIDLAEYADSVPAMHASKGVVTRRYLLRESKTNATMRLSIRVEPVGSPPPFTAPPLPNGEILAGVATLLSTQEDVYRTRPRALDLYAPVPTTMLSRGSSKPNVALPFDVRVLPRAYGPRPTESLIDALFNPAPVRDEKLVGPFTRLVTEDVGSIPTLPSFPSYTSTSMSTTYSYTSSSSRPSTPASVSTRSVAPSPSTENAPLSTAPGSSGHGSLAPSRSSTSGHRPSLSASASTGGSASGSTDSRSHHWWQRNRSRSRSRAALAVS